MHSTKHFRQKTIILVCTVAMFFICVCATLHNTAVVLLYQIFNIWGTGVFFEGFVWILSNFRFLLKPLLFRAFSYKGFTSLNSSSLMDNDERRVCSPLWVAASKYLVGDLRWNLHKAGYRWAFYMGSNFQWIDLR